MVKNHCLCSQAWGKGVVFINGRNLGRYWSIGPQQTLFLPATWLHRGNNQVWYQFVVCLCVRDAVSEVYMKHLNTVMLFSVSLFDRTINLFNTLL